MSSTTETRPRTRKGKEPVPPIQPKEEPPQPEVSSVADYFKDEQSVKAMLVYTKSRNTAINKLADFSAHDHVVSVTELSYGQALYNILQLPIDTQKAVVHAIAEKNKVPAPAYPEGPKSRGRQPSGRKQLSEALYGRWPEMLALEGKNKDTRAGMQITD